MKFTEYQYDEAIKRLQDAKKQLEPDGDCCSICGDSGHMAFECGFNPLVAVAICVGISRSADTLHEQLHYLAGYEQNMGVQIGPRKVIEPPKTKEEDPNYIPEDNDECSQGSD